MFYWSAASVSLLWFVQIHTKPLSGDAFEWKFCRSNNNIRYITRIVLVMIHARLTKLVTARMEKYCVVTTTNNSLIIRYCLDQNLVQRFGVNTTARNYSNQLLVGSHHMYEQKTLPILKYFPWNSNALISKIRLNVKQERNRNCRSRDEGNKHANNLESRGKVACELYN